MGKMLYTKDGELAVKVDKRPLKGIFDIKKVACFYHVFDPAEVQAAKNLGWLEFTELLEGKPPGLTMKHRGRGRYSVYDDAGNAVLENVSKKEAQAKVQ